MPACPHCGCPPSSEIVGLLLKMIAMIITYLKYFMQICKGFWTIREELCFLKKIYKNPAKIFFEELFLILVKFKGFIFLFLFF